jgi:type VI secretion system secreted protein Hcp
LRAKTLDSEGSPCRLHVLRNMGSQLNLMMQFVLTQVLISDIQFQSHPDDKPTEEFKLNFTDLSWAHYWQDQ